LKPLEGLKKSFGEPEPVALAAKLNDWRKALMSLNSPEIWQAHGEWITKTKPRFGPLILDRFLNASKVTEEQAETQGKVRAQVAEEMAELLDGDAVLFWPTAPGPAPFLNTPPEAVESFRFRILSLTSVAGLARLPQINLPLAEAEGAPLGLSIIAAHGNDMLLLSLAREIMQAVQ
jgi:amidase